MPSLVATCAEARSDGEPRIVPFPSPARGPEIRRVEHDAVAVLNPGSRLRITVHTGAGLTVSAAIGKAIAGIPCAPEKEEPTVYRCDVILTDAALGLQRVTAQVRGSEGPPSRLSAALPVEVRAVDLRALSNVLNARLRPVRFTPSSAELSEEARRAIRSNLELLKEHDQFLILVEGHCDPKEEGDLEELSSRRARAVLESLAGLGIPKERMKASGMGARQPASLSRDATEQAINRRATVSFELRSPPDGL